MWDVAKPPIPSNCHQKLSQVKIINMAPQTRRSTSINSKTGTNTSNQVEYEQPRSQRTQYNRIANGLFKYSGPTSREPPPMPKVKTKKLTKLRIPSSPQLNRPQVNGTQTIPRMGKYKILRTLGQGNFAQVKLAIHLTTGREVAIKMIDKTALNKSCQTKLAREVKVMKTLSHPNIVQLYEVIETARHVYLVIEYAKNGEIFDYLIKNGRMDEAQARDKLRQMISAVQYCHQKHIVHRDLKAENLLLDQQNNIKLADFGFANTFQTNSYLDTFCGSPPYAAPELLGGKKYTGPEVDVWALGVILYLLVSGSLPFEAQTLKELHQKITRCEYRVPYYMSRSCELMLKKMLVIDPAKRSTLEELMNEEWLTNGYENEPLKPYQEPSLAYDDPVRIAIMNELGFCEDEIREIFEKRIFNNVRATYLLLQDNETRYRLTMQLALKNSLSNNEDDDDDDVDDEEVEDIDTEEDDVERAPNRYEQTRSVNNKSIILRVGDHSSNVSPAQPRKKWTTVSLRRNIPTVVKVDLKNQAKKIGQPSLNLPGLIAASSDQRAYYSSKSNVAMEPGDPHTIITVDNSVDDNIESTNPDDKVNNATNAKPFNSTVIGPTRINTNSLLNNKQQNLNAANYFSPSPVRRKSLPIAQDTTKFLTKQGSETNNNGITEASSMKPNLVSGKRPLNRRNTADVGYNTMTKHSEENVVVDILNPAAWESDQQNYVRRGFIPMSSKNNINNDEKQNENKSVLRRWQVGIKDKQGKQEHMDIIIKRKMSTPHGSTQPQSTAKADEFHGRTIIISSVRRREHHSLPVERKVYNNKTIYNFDNDVIGQNQETKESTNKVITWPDRIRGYMKQPTKNFNSNGFVTKTEPAQIVNASKENDTHKPNSMSNSVMKIKIAPTPPLDNEMIKGYYHNGTQVKTINQSVNVQVNGIQVDPQYKPNSNIISPIPNEVNTRFTTNFNSHSGPTGKPAIKIIRPRRISWASGVSLQSTNSQNLSSALAKLIDQNHFQFNYHNPFCVTCNTPPGYFKKYQSTTNYSSDGTEVKWEMEIIHLPKLNTFGVKFKHLSGDLIKYRTLEKNLTNECAQILNKMI